MNNGIFSSFDKTNSSINKAGYSSSGLIQYEAMINTLPQSALIYTKPVDGIYHIPPLDDWKIDYNKIVYLIDTTRRRGNYATGYTQDVDKSFVFFLVGVPGGFGGTAVIDWGDGTIEKVTRGGYTDPSVTHYYNNHGLYIIQFYWLNDAPTQGYNVQINNPARADTRDGKCVGILSFDSRSTTLNQFVNNFITCDFVPKNIPRTVTTLINAFSGSTGAYKNVGLWDTSNITNMAGTFYAFNNNGVSSFNEDLSNWNTSNVLDMNNMFADNVAFNNREMTGISGWDTSKVTNMSIMFGSIFRVNRFNQPIGNWNVSNVTNMERMFGGHDAGGGISIGNKFFNQDIGSWNVSKVTNMSNMFYGASAFNNASSSGINNWNMSACINMSQMFKGANLFNQPIGNWNISGVTNMFETFRQAPAFNQNLNNWNVRKVTNFTSMFQGATIFNGSLSGWAPGADTSGTICTFMFNSASNFNQPLSSWNTTRITATNGMFANHGVNGFNQNIGNWNTSNITNMALMFYFNTIFNNGGSSSISGWDTSKVTDMNFTFYSQSFNQPIGNWNVSKVTNMAGMFNGANAFQQNISNWNIVGLNASTSLDGFMNGKTGANSYSTTNYDALLIGWNNNKASGVNGIGNWRTDLRPNFGGAKYTAGGAAATARAALVSYGWTITDGGSV